MKPILACLLAGLLAIIPMATTGCSSYSTAQVVAGVTKVDNVLQGIEAQLPAVQTVANAFQQTDPEVYEYIAPILATAKPALDKIHAACVIFEQNPGADAYQAILNAVDALASQWDQAAMRLTGIKNPNTQQQAVLWTTAVLTSVHVGLGILEQFATKKQVNAVPVKAARIDQIRQFIDRNQAERELADAGYKNSNAILEAYGL